MSGKAKSKKKAESTTVKVVVRCRPMNSKEKGDGREM
jgi:hypothetical protein